MRTSGAPADGLLSYIPFLVAAGVLLALFGGPSTLLRSIDAVLRDFAVGLADVVRSAAASL